MATPQSASLSLMFGLDFGTTFSSIAHALIDHASTCSEVKHGRFDIGLINEVLFEGSKQAKTELAWAPHPSPGHWIWGEAVGREIKSQQIQESDRIALFKLGLDKSEDTQPIRSRIHEQLQALPRESGVQTLDDLIRTYLRLLFNHAMAKIRDCYGKAYGQDILDIIKIESVVCVPAMWIHHVNQRMRDIAISAGIPNVEIVSEPEAAALFMQYDGPRFYGPLNSAITSFKQPFIVLDVGGGTADVVSYLAENESISQDTLGIGGLHGSSKLNRSFGALFVNFLGPHMERLVFDWMTDFECDSLEARRAIIALAENGFEDAKQRFTSTSEDNETFMIQFPPGLRNYSSLGIRHSSISFPRSQIAAEVFAQLVDPIIDLVQQEMSRFRETYSEQKLEIKHVYFVGGASGNEYIKKCLKQAFPSITTPHEDSATLISRGSILQAIHRAARCERVMGYSLGFAWDEEYNHQHHPEPYDRAVHGSKKVETDRFDDRQIVKTRIKWLFRVNQNVRPGSYNSMTGWRALDIKGEIWIQEFIYASKTETRDHLPVQDPDNDIKQLGYVEVKLSNKDRKSFLRTTPLRYSRGISWQYLEYRVRITYLEAKMKYEIIVPRRGVAECEADWDNNPMCKEVPLIRDEVLDTTKQRALAPLTLSHEVCTQSDEQPSSGSETVVSTRKARSKAVYPDSPDDDNEAQRRRRQRKLKSRAKVLKVPQTPSSGTGLAKRKPRINKIRSKDSRRKVVSEEP